MKLRIFLAGLIGMFVTIAGPMSTAQAAMYIYQLPDGSRIVTDYPMSNKHYKLVRASRNVQGMGALVASREPQFFRARTSNYDHLIKRMAGEYGVDPALVKAVIHAESAFNPYATSHKGASGLMQLMPATAEEYGVTDIYDPIQNIRAGVQYLRDLLGMYENRSRLALAAYNAGPRAVKRYRGIPPYKETRRYVKKVLKYKRRYAKKLRLASL